MQNKELSVAVVCASNQNRSMAAHKILAEHGINVTSFGTGSQVKMPGLTRDTPNVYEFGTTYEHMYNDLRGKDESFYTRNGLLHMLDRNRKIKNNPQRFQDEFEHADLVFCFEERVFDTVVDELQDREPDLQLPVHIFNMDTTDTHNAAVDGAQHCLRFVQMVLECEDWGDEISEVVEDFEARTGNSLLHTVLYI